MSFPVRNSKSKKLQKETNNKFPNSPKPKSKSKSKARMNPLRRGVVYTSLSNMLKNFANKSEIHPKFSKTLTTSLKDKSLI